MVFVPFLDWSFLSFAGWISLLIKLFCFADVEVDIG